MNDLLICIACHYNHPNGARLKYLTKVLNNIAITYKCSYDIIIDTNSAYLESALIIEKVKNVKFNLHTNLSHPFNLTWKHRKHIKENIDNYENFMYIEDDMLVPYENYLNYLENFKLLYPKYVPSFIRIEEKEGENFVSDAPKQVPLNVIEIGNKSFCELPFLLNYHAFWIMPGKELKESMKDNFVNETDGREFAAMYVGWSLGKPTLVEIENNLISEKCYSYHLPNNYALGDGLNGKIKPENIFL